MRIRTLIVDDESLARQKLRRYLADEGDVEIVGEARNGPEAITLTERLKPDLLILDIQMPGMNGFEVLEALVHPPLVIFATAYDQYAIRAFEVNSLDYLLKPFSKERLREALTRAKRWLEGGAHFEARLARLLKSLEKKPYLTKLVAKDVDKIVLIDVRDVLWIGSEKTLNFVHTRKGTYPTDRTLRELEQKLDPQQFFRIHRFTIVHIDAIAEIIPWFGGDYKVTLKDPEKTSLILSRRRVKAFKEIFPW